MSEHTHDTLIQDMIGRRIENLFPRQRGPAGERKWRSRSKACRLRRS